MEKETKLVKKVKLLLKRLNLPKWLAPFWTKEVSTQRSFGWFVDTGFWQLFLCENGSTI